MTLFPLDIFPIDSLSSSVITTVWVGMTVVCFFNLRLGWVLSGLVVPGYLTPLLLIKPWSGAIVLLEGVLTYFAVWLFSEQLSRWAPWSNFFGRDRFFALVLTSIIVRLLFDGWLLPELGLWLHEQWHINFDYRNHLHSFGLIIVALVANQFWKSGFLRGAMPFSATLLVTVLLVRHGLMEFTNFSLSSVSYLYEDMATSILATPKAYIILVSAAFLASRMNLHYGWDFNGILIPSLLALQWYQPLKILVTVLESGLILLLASLLLKTPWLRRQTIEGASKLLLFFNIGFAYKILLAYAILAWFPDLKITDHYGFGYLLSTLIAVKIHDKEILARLIRATLQTSLAAVLFASLIGFILTLLPLSALYSDETPPASAESQATSLPTLDQDLPALLQAERILLYQVKLRKDFLPPLYEEISYFSKAINHIKNHLLTPDPAQLQLAADYLAKVDYQLHLVKGRYLYLHEASDRRGWGMYIIDTQAPTHLTIEIPAPLDEENVLEAGTALFTNLGAKTLAISGGSRSGSDSTAADVLTNNLTFFHAFHRSMANHDGLQLRSYTAETARLTSGARREQSQIDLPDLKSSLWVKNQLPDSLDTVKLKQLIGGYDVSWTAPAFFNQQREASARGFAELLLAQADVRKLLAKSLLANQTIASVEQDIRIDGYLQDWILNKKQEIAEKGSNLYQAPKLEELLYMDEQVLTPLLKLIDRYDGLQAWSAAEQDDLQIIGQSAAAVGYQIIRYRHRPSQQDYLILTEMDDRPHRYWGIYVFRILNTRDYLVQIPRPLFEINSFEYGAALFERLQAKALAIATTDPHANLDHSADLLAPENKASILNLFHQVLLREYRDRELLVINSRAYGQRADMPAPEADVVFSGSSGLQDRSQLLDPERALLQTLETDGMSVQRVDGSQQTMGYEQNHATQARYLSATTDKRFVTLWLSPFVRAHFRQQDDNQWQRAQFQALNIPSMEQDLAEYLRGLPGNHADLADSQAFNRQLAAYAKNQNVLVLQQLQDMATSHGYQLTRLIDTNSKQAFVLISNRAKQWLAVANIGAANDRHYRLDYGQAAIPQLTAFVQQRAFWLDLVPGGG